VATPPTTAAAVRSFVNLVMKNSFVSHGKCR